MECSIHSVKSGVPRKASWSEFSIAIHCYVFYKNIAYIQAAAALHRVRTTTVEKTDAGTLDQCLGSSDFPY